MVGERELKGGNLPKFERVYIAVFWSAVAIAVVWHFI